MRLTRLRIEALRCLTQVELEPGPGLNLVLGDNGAGKTSVVEAIHLLGYGRSFRGRVRDGLIARDAEAVTVVAEWAEHGGGSHRAGLRHFGTRWEARLDGEAVPTLGDLCARVAAVTFEPGSHELVTGGAEHRRRFLDWGLFHVEQTFLPVWRRYQRALKQRNALLKSGPSGRTLDPWDAELAEAGEALHRLRQTYLDRLEPWVTAAVARLLPELGALDMGLSPGWRRDELSLADALLIARPRDLAGGFTSAGPHRADWKFGFQGHPGRDVLSRGQAKLTALACLLGQAEAHAAARGTWPVLCLDDLGSELDRRHLGLVFDTLVRSGAQAWITGTERPAGLPSDHPAAVFHVERGQIRRI